MYRDYLIICQKSRHQLQTETGNQLVVRLPCTQTKLQCIELEKMLCAPVTQNPVNSRAGPQADEFQNTTTVRPEGVCFFRIVFFEKDQHILKQRYRCLTNSQWIGEMLLFPHQPVRKRQIPVYAGYQLTCVRLLSEQHQRPVRSQYTLAQRKQLLRRDRAIPRRCLLAPPANRKPLYGSVWWVA